MELIDKDALVEYIKQRYMEHQTGNQSIGCLDRMDEDKVILSFLNVLEVKEVDLEKELDEWMKYGPHTNYPWCTIPDAIKITAEHFFELGLKTLKGE